jgi:serine O-acetyltransferase
MQQRAALATPPIAARIRQGTLRLDCYRVTGGTGWSAVLRALLTWRTFRPIATLRAYQALRRRGGAARLLRPFVTAGHRFLCVASGIELPLELEVGPGFCILHGWGLVVNGGAKLGRNVTVMQGVTIGRADAISADGSRSTGYPVIGNDVWIGPGAVVVGGVHIGDGCRILPNSVVTTDLEPGSMAGGAPAKVVRAHVPRDVVNPVDALVSG